MSDASLGRQIFTIPAAQIEAIAEPDGIRNDIWRKAMAFVGIHPPILPK